MEQEVKMVSEEKARELEYKYIVTPELKRWVLHNWHFSVPESAMFLGTNCPLPAEFDQVTKDTTENVH